MQEAGGKVAQSRVGVRRGPRRKAEDLSLCREGQISPEKDIRHDPENIRKLLQVDEERPQL